MPNASYSCTHLYSGTGVEGLLGQAVSSCVKLCQINPWSSVWPCLLQHKGSGLYPVGQNDLPVGQERSGPAYTHVCFWILSFRLNSLSPSQCLSFFFFFSTLDTGMLWFLQRWIPSGLLYHMICILLTSHPILFWICLVFAPFFGIRLPHYFRLFQKTFALHSCVTGFLSVLQLIVLVCSKLHGTSNLFIHKQPLVYQYAGSFSYQIISNQLLPLYNQRYKQQDFSNQEKWRNC